MTKELLLSSRYSIIEKIGVGGMANVYKARDTVLYRNVAIKVLKDEYDNNSSFITSFIAEASSAANLSHPNIVDVYDVVNEADNKYIVMELIEGTTLRNFYKSNSVLSIGQFITIFSSVCKGLSHAHKKGIIHRDIKPHNILLSKDERILITDFGIAKAVDSQNTQTDTLMGSIHYSSPEHINGGMVDSRSDIYSLGITMFETLTGDVPFNGENAINIAMKHLKEKCVFDKKFKNQIPVDIQNLVLKCLEKDPNKRYNSTTEIYDLLHKYILKHDSKLDTEDLFSLQKNKVNTLASTTRKVSKANKLKYFIIGLTLFIASIILIVLMLMNIGDNKNNIIPDVKGKTYVESLSIMNDSGIDNIEKVDVNNNDISKNIVIETIPEAGNKVGENDIVSIVVSKGVALFEMPSIIDNTLEKAKEILNEKELKYSVSYEESDFLPDTVIRQFPLPGSIVDANEEVKITVTKEKPKKNVLVPELIGYQETIAKNILHINNLIVGDITYVSNPSFPDGSVVSQSINGNEEVLEGTTIDLSINKVE